MGTKYKTINRNILPDFFYKTNKRFFDILITIVDLTKDVLQIRSQSMRTLIQKQFLYFLQKRQLFGTIRKIQLINPRDNLKRKWHIL